LAPLGRVELGYLDLDVRIILKYIIRNWRELFEDRGDRLLNSTKAEFIDQLRHHQLIKE
jgi:hypothetical protein